MTAPLIMHDHARPGDHIIVPRTGSGVIRVAMIVAVLTSAGWYWQLLDERDAHHEQIVAERMANDRLLADAVARMTPIQSLTISYANGAQLVVYVNEVTP